MLREPIHGEIRHRASAEDRGLEDRDLDARGTADKGGSKLREGAEKVKALELHQHHHKAGERIILSQFSQQSALIS